MKIGADDLIFEVTRKCNMGCKHCLRGNQRNINMHKKTVRNTLDNICSIEAVTFTGGEPTLNVNMISFIIHEIKARKIGVRYFYIVTNGKIYSRKLIKLLKDFREYCDSPEECALSLTLDDGFHQEINPRNIIRYKGLDFYDSQKEGRTRYTLNEGRAKQNNIGSRTLEQKEFMRNYEIKDDTLNLYDDLVYINAEGEVLLDCDCSYETQEKWTIGNVNKTNLVDILKSVLKEKDEPWLPSMSGLK